MIRVFNTDGTGDDETVPNVWDVIDYGIDGIDINIFIPGPAGPAGAPATSTDVGSRAHPVLVSSEIAGPVYRCQRSFIAGSTGPIYNPTIPSPSDNGPWELVLFCTSNVNTITLENQSNIQLSGEWVGKLASILTLQWDGQSMYVEGGRNEI